MAPATPDGEVGPTHPVARIPPSAPAVGVLTLLPLALLAVFMALTEVDGRRGVEAARDVPTAEFDDVFGLDRRVVLEEPESAVISRIRTVDVRDDGVLAVADPRQDQVQFYDADGRLLSRVGGSGAGPGELQFPGDLAFGARGRLFVAEAGEPRVSVFGRDLAFDTLFRVGGAHFPTEVGSPGDRLVVYVNQPEAGGEALRIYSPRGERRRDFHPEREEYRTVPYWSSAVQRVMAVSPSYVVAGGNLLYPFPVYGPDGSFRDSVGTPPSSWEAAPRPELNDFSGPDQVKQFEAWRRTFTTVDDLAIYRDSLLVIAHEELDPDVLAYEEATYRADVYSLESGRKLVEDVPLPGRLLNGGEHLHVLLSSPPGPWAIGMFEVLPGEDGP